MANETTDPRTVLLKNVRLAFTDSLKDKKATVEDGEPKHSCSIIVEKGKPQSDANLAAIRAALEAAGDKEWKKPDAWKEITEDEPKRVCFRKGERFKNVEGVIYKGFEGNFGISASGPKGGKSRPKLLDRHKRSVEEKDILDVFYGGTYADVYVSFFGTTKGGRGIFASVEMIRSRQEGEALGGGFNGSADAMEDLPDDDAFDKPAAADKAPAGGADDDMFG